MASQQTYQPPPLPNGASWSPNALPVRFDPTTRQWQAFFNGSWQAKPEWTFEQVNAMGRAGQAFQVDYAASGGQANTAAVQREIAPRVFAADAAQLSPEGSILAAGTPRQAVATQQRPNPTVFAPDGAELSGQGSILSLPNTGPATAPAPAAPMTANVDPGATWDYSGAPPRTAASPTRTQPAPPDSGDLFTAQAALAQQQGQGQPPTRDQQWLEYLLGSSPAMSGGTGGVQGETPAFRHGGYQRPRYAEGGAQGPMSLPDAIVGEGLETATPQFDTPERSELTLEPMPALGPDIFKVKVAEGPTGVQADGGMLVLPLSEPAAAIAREHLRPTEGIKGEMQGDTFQSGPLQLPTAPGPGGAGTPALASGGLAFDIYPPQPQQPQQPPPFEGIPPLDPSQVHKGLYPPQSLAVPSAEWAGLPGGAPPPLGNVNELARANPAQLARYDQWLKSLGILSGIEGIAQDLRRSAPTRLNLPTVMG